MARIRNSTSTSLQSITGWQLAEVPHGAGAALPSELPQLGLAWLEAQVPGTVASSLRLQNSWSFDSLKDFDASEFWYRTQFAAAPALEGETLRLCFEGLATLADVWLNGQHVLHSDNMFRSYELDVSDCLRAQNELLIRFSSLKAATAERRPRPAFRTRLIERQQLRWFRTTLLGRMPSWTPPVSAVGPWREVTLERRRGISLLARRLSSAIEAGRAIVHANFVASALAEPISSATLRVGPASMPLELSRDALEVTLSGTLVIEQAQRWWPNGHGAQPRYETTLEVTSGDTTQVFQFDSLAFRTIEAASGRDGLALLINGVEIRCRGACWTPTDVVSLQDRPSTLATLAQAQSAGMNMLRVGGTMIYESDAFYEECDRLGILIWQDFMFANCDYPAEDPAFLDNVEQESTQFLARTQTRACIALLCGSSEVEQQISMLGLPKELWKPSLFERTLRKLANDWRPDVPYLPSSPSGGALPFQADAGVTHYYGVGAYLRPLEDARRADVKFASECLAFANIPEPVTVQQLLGEKAPFHDPRWKLRVPRDNGPGWDFDDVRDHYVKLLFGVDPTLLRYQDPERALALGRVATGEVMARTLAEWRRGASTCRGALIWLLRDLWPGAGWGIIDSNGLPKAAYYYVKRAMQPRAVLISDEGVNGLVLHVVNDTDQLLVADLELVLWRGGATRVAAGRARLEVAPHSTQELGAARLFDHFIDTTHAYRFGPPAYDVAVASLLDAASGLLISDATYFVGVIPHERAPDLGLTVCVEATGDAGFALRVTATRFAQSVAVELADYLADDSYFHLSPGQARLIQLQPLAAASTPPRGVLRPLNAQMPTRVSVATPGTGT